MPARRRAGGYKNARSLRMHVEHHGKKLKSIAGYKDIAQRYHRASASRSLFSFWHLNSPIIEMKRDARKARSRFMDYSRSRGPRLHRRNYTVYTGPRRARVARLSRASYRSAFYLIGLHACAIHFDRPRTGSTEPRNHRITGYNCTASIWSFRSI